MKTSRICAGVVATLAMFAGDYAHADPTAAGDTVVLNTFQTIWLKGDGLGPLQNGAPRIGKNTGAGLMDAQFTFDAKSNPADILLGTTFTRSQATKNQNAANDSYMQGGFALAHLTQTGVAAGPQIDLPELEGERTWMRPQIAFTPTHTIIIAASEDNGVNNNPQPVMFIADRAGVIQKIPNNTRGANNLLKPTNLIQTALNQGINVQNPNNQRGPHSIAQVGPNSFVVGMQYNNQAAEAFKVTVATDGTVTMNWLKRYSNTAQHCRPQVVVADGATEGFVAEVEANNQPAEIGFRITKFNVATGAVVASKIAVRSDPKANKYVAEPSVGLVGDKLAVGYQMSASVNRRANNGNGHAGGSQVSLLNLFSTTDLTPIGEPMLNAAAYGRHSTMFATTYGPNAEPALAYIGGSSTGTKGAFEQLIPLKADGTLGLKDSAKLYAVSTYSDVANVQARGKRNPNNQARGFINGLGSVPNPGFNKGATAFMPETKSFSFSTITGYTDAAGAAIGKRNSIYLSLVPASWATGIQTTPGTPTSTPGVGPDGQPSQTGPAPRTTAPSTNPSGDMTSTGTGDTNVLAGTDPTTADGTPDGSGRAQLGADSGGCSVSSTSSSSTGGRAPGFILLAVAGVIVALRRKQEEV
jgi:MYXO-CTERM domain-containing protein